MNEIHNFIESELPIVMSNLHFLRADWFYAFIPVIIFLFLLLRSGASNKHWNAVIDRQLLPFVLSRSNDKRRKYPLLLAFIAASLCITALAGPVYKKLPQPVYREQSSLVVLLDLSQSMNAADIKPSRLARAKLKLLDLLKTRKTGQTALIVYAADAFVVTPLTDDNATIANLIPSLETNMMPAQGSNLSAALAKTFSLFSQAGTVHGDILVITDDINVRDKAAIKKVTSLGHRLSVFAIGTVDGAPVPLNNASSEQTTTGFLLDSDGAIVVPKLRPAKLQQFALIGSGLFTTLQADDSDIDKLASLFQSSRISSDDETKDTDRGKNDTFADIWQEEGYWLLLPLLFFAALWSRKGWLAVFLPVVISLSIQFPQPAHAAGTDDDIQHTVLPDTRYLWLNPDQKAMREYDAGNNETAAETFTRKDWKASAQYKSGDYEAAAETLKDANDSDGLYNRANALAKLGKYKEAVSAYNRALELDENNADAEYNRELVKKALQQQKQQNKKQDGDKQDGDKQDGEKQDSEKQDGEKQDGEKQDGDKQDGEKQDGEKQDGDKKDGENQDDKNKDGKNQRDDEQNQQSEADTKQQSGDKEKSEQQDGSARKDGDKQKTEAEELKQRDAAAEKKQQEKEKQQYEQQQSEKNNETAEDNKDKPGEIENREGEEKPAEVEVNPVEASITEDQKATEQWLKRIPDDPGGLLRRKFHYQYKNLPGQHDENEPW